MGAWYCTRENIFAAIDAGETLRARTQVDRLIEQESRAVDKLCSWRPQAFVPVTATRTFDWPNSSSGTPWRLWLGADRLVSATTVTAGGVTIAAADYFLRPDTGPPYDRIEIDLASQAAFATGDTHQRAVSIAGVYSVVATDDRTAGALAEALDASETGVDVSAAAAAAVGVGSVLLCESERMIVTARTAIDSAVNTSAALTASRAETTVAVGDGAAFAAGETILIDSERMLINDISGNNLTVARAQDGTVLAAHSNPADVYVYRRLTVERGALGTTAATHADAIALTRLQVPGPVEGLVVGRVLARLGWEGAGYAGTAGSGESARSTAAPRLADLAAEVVTDFGRGVRHRAV